MLSATLFAGVSRVVRIASIVAVVLVVAGLVGFLVDEVRDTSEVQATRFVGPGETRDTTVVIDVTQPDPPRSVERVREREHSGGRELIDDVGDVLMKPFSWIADGSEPWVRRLLYSALALVVYGFLLQLLADLVFRAGDGSRRAAIAERERKAAEERRRTGSFVSPA